MYALPQHQPVWDLHRLVAHIRHVPFAAGDQDPNRKNRIEYMLGTITEEQFRFRIQCSEKAREKQKNIRDILEMFVTVGIDMLHTVIETMNIQEFETQRSWLLEYSNSELDKIRNLYRTMVPRIVGDDLKNVRYESRVAEPLNEE
jgi:hypothetical protein